MTFTGQFCVDGIRFGTLEPGWIAYGWWLGQRPIKRLVLEDQSGAVEPVWWGVRRRDVGAAFPTRADAARSGFIARVPNAGRDPKQSTLAPMRWWVEDDEGRWWQQAFDMAQRTPADFASAEAANPSAAVRACMFERHDPEPRFRLAVSGFGGVTLRLDITNKCNLRCVMCHYQLDDVFRRPVKNLTPAEFEQWFADVSPILSEVVLSCADEPLISKFFPDIVRLIRRTRPSVEIKFCTNATLMSAPIRQLLVEEQVDMVVLSIDGCTRAMFESIRTGAKFERVIGNVLALEHSRRTSGSRKPELVANFVMMQRNLHEAPAFVGMARRLGISTIDFRHVVASYEGFDMHAEQLKNAPGRFNFYRNRILAEGHREHVHLFVPPAFEPASTWGPDGSEPVASMADFENVCATFVPDEPLSLPEDAGFGSRVPQWLQLSNLFGDTFCRRPFSEIMVREQREVMPCPWHLAVLGEMAPNASLLEVFLGDRFRELRRLMLRPEGAEACRMCPLKSHELSLERFE